MRTLSFIVVLTAWLTIFIGYLFVLATTMRAMTNAERALLPLCSQQVKR
jgi:hypothetical protein